MAKKKKVSRKILSFCPFIIEVIAADSTKELVTSLYKRQHKALTKVLISADISKYKQGKI